MAARSSRSGRPNPFYVALLLTSTLFAVTAIAYYISPMVGMPRGGDGAPTASPPSLALAAWLDRRGPLALGVEFLVMSLAGLLAMLTDRWFSPRIPSA